MLQPSTDPLDPGDLQRDTIPGARGELEIWRSRHAPSFPARQKILLVKFPGTGGRAENSSGRPALFWDQIDSVVWTINPFGYGGSSGPASLQRFPEMIDAIASAIRDRHPDRQLLVLGNSLGSISALALAARMESSGVMLRNPVPIHELIRERPRYAWPSFGLSRWVAAQIPETLNAIDNARSCSAPCLVISARRDRLVPPRFQDRILSAYGGAVRVLALPQADHHDPIPAGHLQEYMDGLKWLEDAIPVRIPDQATS